MTDLKILQNGSISEKVYNVFEKYKPLIMKKACLYERCSRGRIDKDDFISDVYEKLYYFVGRLKIEKVKDLNRFSYYKSVHFAILRVYYKARNVFDCEKLFDLDEDGNEKIQLVSKNIVSETAPDISKFMNDLSERQRFVIRERMNGKTFQEIRTVLNCSHGTVVRDVFIAKKVYNKHFSI